MITKVVTISRRVNWLLRHRQAFGGSVHSDLPRLLVDVSAILRHDAQTGVQRVVRAVWNELKQRDGHGFRLVPVHASHDHGYCYADRVMEDRFEPSSTLHPVMGGAGDKFLGLDLSAHFLPKYRRQIRAWRGSGATIHLVVYDLLPILRPEWFNNSTTAHFRKWFAVLANEADQAICISRQVSTDLDNQLKLWKESKLKIVNMPLGGNIAASRPSSGISQELNLLLERFKVRPSILMVGTIEPRKGHEAAIAAFDHLWASHSAQIPDLVIVGKAGWQTSALQNRIRRHPEYGARLHWLDNVSDEGLCRLYDASRGLLMASYGEGFGLPVVEAISRGKPVLARDIPVFREQESARIRYFEDDRPAVLGECVMELMALRSEPRPTSSSFPTWRASVDTLIRQIGLG